MNRLVLVLIITMIARNLYLLYRWRDRYIVFFLLFWALLAVYHFYQHDIIPVFLAMFLVFGYLEKRGRRLRVLQEMETLPLELDRKP